MTASAVGVTHNVKIGTKYCLIRPGTYRKKAAPTFGARFATGDPSYNNLSFWQHWVQSCWVGGMDSPEWKDDSMFDQAVGIDITNHEFIALARDLTRGTGTWTVNGDSADCVREFVVYAGALYCLMHTSTTDSYLYKYTPGTDSWGSVKTFSGKQAKSAAVFNNCLYIGTDSTTVLEKFDGTNWTTVAHPAGRAEAVTAMRQFRDRLYVCYGGYIWRLKSDDTWDGATVFFEATGVDSVAATEIHLGYLYFLSSNGHILRTDGNNTFDIWNWDGSTKGVSLRSYDGRLFVGTYEYVDTSDCGQGVLYQLSGSAVTQLKRWGKVGKATTIGNLVVYDRKLYYGASSLFGMADGFGVAVYDSVEDGHSIFASSRDTATYADSSGIGRDWMVDDLIVFEGYLFVSVRGHGLFRTPLRFRDIALEEATFDRTGNGVDATPPNGGWLTSSDYDAGTPGLEKLWRQMRVTCDLPDEGCTVSVEYSLDGGTTWVLASTITKTGSATRYQATLPLQNVKGPRLKYRLSLRSTVSSKTPQVRGIAISYVPMPEPNWIWDFSVVASNRLELLDGSTEVMDAGEFIAYFETLFRSGELVDFTDIDGTKWATNGPGALIYDFGVNVNVLPDDEIEGELRFTLLEAVESYS